MSLFRRHPKPPRKAGGTAYPRQHAALTDEDVDAFHAAASQRSSGIVPSIYDLVACLEELQPSNPIEVRSTTRQLRWLMKASASQLGTEWEHPL